VIALGIGATRDVQVYTEITVAVLFEQRGTQFLPLLVAPAMLDFDRVESGLQTRNVRAKADHFATVGWNDFVNSIAKQKSAIHWRYTGFFERQEFSI
jgi:hypothetical protein